MDTLPKGNQHPEQEMTTKQYAEELRKWTGACACWQATVLHYCYAAYQDAAQLTLLNNAVDQATWNAMASRSTVDSNIPQVRRTVELGPEANNNVNNMQAAGAGGNQPPLVVTRFRVPPVWKRICAEGVDFIILMTIRIVLVVISIKLFSLDETLLQAFTDWSLGDWAIARFGLREPRAAEAQQAPHRDANGQAQAQAQGKWLPFGYAFGEAAEQEDVEGDEEIDYAQELEDLLLFSPLYVLLELLNTLVVTAYETLFTMREWRRGAGACTPGKLLFGLRLVRANQMLELPDAPDRGLLGPPGLLVEVRGDPTYIGFGTALCRAAMKNFSQTFLFPLSFTALFARNHRAVYDLVTNVIVVERE